jgi:hypothetical protein
MDTAPEDGNTSLPSLSRQFSSEEINMDLTMCGLLIERAEELAQLYREHGNWNEVEQVWFEERLSNRSTRGSSRKIFRVLTSRLKNAPSSLPNPRDLPVVLNECETARDKAQVLYFYLVADDGLVRYAVHEYGRRLLEGQTNALDFSNESLTPILDQFEYADGSSFDYADSTTERWCEGFRAVMRKIGVLENQQSVVGTSPSVGKIPLLVSMGYSYRQDNENWFESPTGHLYLLQPKNRWQELYDRAASNEAWEYLDLHGELQLRPTDGPYSWIGKEGEI